MPDTLPMSVHFTLHCFDPPRQITPEDLSRFATDIGLQAVAPGRISGLLLTQVIAHIHRYGIEPERFVAEIKHLEGIPGYERSLTKPGTRFSREGSLAGLHHKHFTASTVGIVAANVLAARPPEVLLRIAEEELGDGATPDALQRFTDRVVLGGYERRAAANRLTGEWIVYAEHEGKNYYLCLATHEGGNDEVLRYLRTVSCREFPFLVTKLPHLFADT